MSVDTRTPRAPGAPGGRPGDSQGGNQRGFLDDEPVLSTVKVPSDPAEVVVNHASFRVRLGSGPAAPALGAAVSGATRATRTVAATTPARNTLFDDTEPLHAVTAEAAPGAPAGAGAAAGVGAGAGAAAGARVGAGSPGRRRTPVVWSGRAAPGDASATKLFQAVRTAEAERVHEAARHDASSTQVLPRISDPVTSDRPGEGAGRSGPATVVGPPRGPRPPEAAPLLSGVRPARGAFDDDPDFADLPPHGPGGAPGDTGELDAVDLTGAGHGQGQRRIPESVRNAYYPGRRMNLGVVLLPLRIFLGFITIYAGMGKLCDPVYFDGGKRGSMVTWLRSLDPWTIASPLRDFALAHPVGSGLTVAFLQVIVGVLTMFGLWQRVAAGFGALLSAALLMTVSWSTVPAYDAPDIIYLAAWSPLIIAGAPVYSVDGRLATGAWRKLGPRVDIWVLRRRVLRRGTLIASLVVGLALLVGSLLGSAVRSSQVPPAPERGKTPTNQLPGRSLQKGEPGERTRPGQATSGPGSSTPGARGHDKRRAKRPSASATTPGGEQRASAGPETTPSQRQQETAPAAPQQSAPDAQRQQTPQQPPSASGTSGSAPRGAAGQSPTGSDASSGGSSSGGGSGGGGRTLGGLLGG